MFWSGIKGGIFLNNPMKEKIFKNLHGLTAFGAVFFNLIFSSVCICKIACKLHFKKLFYFMGWGEGRGGDLSCLGPVENTKNCRVLLTDLPAITCSNWSSLKC